MRAGTANILLVAAASAMFGATPLAAQTRERYQILAARVDRGPEIDGALDEAVWQRAAVVDEFTQQEPEEGVPATERTEIRVLYDASNLYIGVHAFDREPEGVIATEMRRDSAQLLDEDNVQVILDTFKDSRSGYMFVTSPLGAKLEQQVFEEGEGRNTVSGAASSVNRNWDGVWDVAARRTPEGWVAEIVIPLVTLRFPEADVQSWGINFMRNIRRKNEQVFWAPIPKAYELTRVSLAGTLTGMTSLSRGLDLRLKPFLVGGVRRDGTGPDVNERGLRAVGLDAKYGLTSGLTLDVTVHTDFAEAEVDTEQVNLTRFPLFFPEKRDFFLENAGQFSVDATSGNERLMNLFFSRRIGLSAAGAPIPILGGARLTGKSGRNNLAVMDLQTDGAFGRSGENFLAARYSRDLFARSKVGGLVINKASVGGGRFNRTFAADTTLVPHRNVTVNSFLAKTSAPGVSDADMAFHVRARFVSPQWDVYGDYTDTQDNFNADVGYVPRTGTRRTRVHVEPTQRPRKYHLRTLEPHVNFTYETDQQNRLVTRRVHKMVTARFDNGASIIVWHNRWFEWLDVPFRIRPDVTIPVGAYHFSEWQVSYASNRGRRFYQSVSYNPQDFYDGTRTDVSLTLGLRATSQLATQVSYSRNDVRLGGGAFVVNLGRLQIDHALSPRTTLRTMTQYNSSTRQLSNSVRFNYRYNAGSDVYITYDDLHEDMPGLPEIRNRQVVVKLTYLLSR